MDSKMTCVFCYENKDSKVVRFKEETLNKCREIMKVRQEHNLKYIDTILPRDVSEKYGYHASCYRPFTAVGRKYLDMSAGLLPLPANVPSNSRSGKRGNQKRKDCKENSGDEEYKPSSSCNTKEAVKMETPDSVQVFSAKYLENISDAFKNLYNEEQLSDVTIYCREGSLKAHKLILAASSPYFYKIFRENRNEFPILILHGTSLNQMKNLIDLLYSGITDVKNDDLEALNTLVKEFEIKGVSFGPKSSASNVRLEMNSNNVSPEGSHNRDTRFKGQKRVAVDYIQEEISRTHLPSTSRADNVDEVPLNKKPNLEIIHMEDAAYVKREITSPAPTESTILSSSDTIISSRSLHSYSENKLSAWAKKQRKFKCDLCPSSFKRSSHLSRHQLVHTGERPYSCDKCDKAFSRHDKLKHHMRKAHEFIPDSMYERIDNDQIDSDVESNNYASPNHNGSENGFKSEYCDLSTPKSTTRETPPLFTISHISSILEDSFVNPPKKGRGRPRKYPPPIAPIVKRGRGRPRCNVYPGRPGVQNYNITNLPYGDLNYLTSQTSAGDDEEASVMMEPLVEINMDQSEQSDSSQTIRRIEREENTIESSRMMETVVIEPLLQIAEQNVKTEQSDDGNISQEEVDISEIETKIGLIGECTISVAN